MDGGSCRDQEGRSGSDEVVPGTSVFPSSATRGGEEVLDLLRLGLVHDLLRDLHVHGEHIGAALAPDRC